MAWSESVRRYRNLWPSLSKRRGRTKRAPGRRLAVESLETRMALAAAGLVDVGVQPDGGLEGKVVYINGGHGNQAANNGNGSWSFQRPLLLNMIEDLGNQDQMSYLADYLFRAGATVVPLRPVGYQPNEVVLDNVSVGVTFSGAWTNSSSSIYFGKAGETPYRYASTSATETAVATYRPTFTVAGHYPVYTWVRSGSDRAADQLYRVNHSGGSTEVTVNHRMVGNGLIYLGTYHFEAGSAGSVEISNRSSEAGRIVIADMIRFGNGMGDTDRGGGVSGRSREDELSLYWIKWQVDNSQGVPTSSYRPSTTNNDGDANVSAIPRFAAYMNRADEGSLSDRVFVSFHSNAGAGTSRGVIGLYNGNNNAASKTPNQLLLASTLATEINADLVAQNGQFEHNWFNRGTSLTLDRSDIEFGEINNLYISNEFDATIIETGYHDNATDAAMLRDPNVRDAIARATYQGLVKYFRAIYGAATPLTMLPGRVAQISAQAVANGAVQINWAAVTASTYGGDAPMGYRIYGSTNGYGFDGGTYVVGGATTSFTMTGLNAADGPYYFKVVAVNAGGEGAASEVVAATPVVSGKKVLIVNGFDRLDRTLNPTQAAAGGQTERVRPRQSNSFDYAVQVASAIRANAPDLRIDSTSNEYVISGAVNLADYEAVFWILGEESVANSTFNATEQAKVSAYMAAGGKLFLSGSEIGWDLDAQGKGVSFYNNVLKADYVADDAATYNASGAAGSIFAGISLTFDNGSQFYNVDYPDRITPLGGATTALTYATGGAAAIQHTDAGTGSQVVMLAFPFETITSAATRDSVMSRVVEYFSLLVAPTPIADFNNDGIVDGNDFLVWQRNYGKANPTLADGDADGDGAVDASDLAAWKQQFGNPAPAAIATAATMSSFTEAPAAAEAFAVDAPAAEGVSTHEMPAMSAALAADFSSLAQRMTWQREAKELPASPRLASDGTRRPLFLEDQSLGPAAPSPTASTATPLDGVEFLLPAAAPSSEPADLAFESVGDWSLAAWRQ